MLPILCCDSFYAACTYAPGEACSLTTRMARQHATQSISSHNYSFQVAIPIAASISAITAVAMAVVAMAAAVMAMAMVAMVAPVSVAPIAISAPPPIAPSTTDHAQNLPP
jgi:hypothetical protein